MPYQVSRTDTGQFVFIDPASETVVIDDELAAGFAKLDMVHVAYKGAGPAVQDIASGNATMGIQDYASTAALIQAGKLVPLATTGTKRIPSYPDVKTFVEQGYPMDLAGWVAFMINYFGVNFFINSLHSYAGT